MTMRTASKLVIVYFVIIVVVITRNGCSSYPNDIPDSVIMDGRHRGRPMWILIDIHAFRKRETRRYPRGIQN